MNYNYVSLHNVLMRILEEFNRAVSASGGLAQAPRVLSGRLGGRDLITCQANVILIVITENSICARRLDIIMEYNDQMIMPWIMHWLYNELLLCMMHVTRHSPLVKTYYCVLKLRHIKPFIFVASLIENSSSFINILNIF